MRAARVCVGVLIPWHSGLLEARVGAFCGSGMKGRVEQRSAVWREEAFKGEYANTGNGSQSEYNKRPGHCRVGYNSLELGRFSSYNSMSVCV